jgi:hypothetical protein
MLTDIFISYAREDKNFVRKLHDALEERGRDTWVDWNDIPLTAHFLEEAYAGIERSNMFTFVMSPDSLDSKYCLQELDHAAENNKRIAPIWYRDVDEEAVPPNLRFHNWVWFGEDDDFEEAVGNLIEALDKDLEWVRAHTRLLTRATEWDEEGRDPSFLLRGRDLEAAERYHALEAEKEPRFTSLQKEYILASRQTATKFQSRLLSAVALGLVLALVLGLVGLWQWREASYQSRVSLGRQLAAEAQLMANEEPSLLQTSMLLAAEAWQRSTYGSIGAEQAMRAGLNLLPSRGRFLVQHEASVLGIAYSPDGERLATAQPG